MSANPVIAGTRVELSKAGRVATIRLITDKGPAILSSSVLGELSSVLERLRTCYETRFIVFRSAGKVFIAGADISEMVNFSENQGYALSKQGQRVFNTIETMPQVTFAAMNGHALGGGCELAMACSFRLLVAGAKIGLPEARLGLIPGWGGTKRLRELVPLGWALRMMYSGEPVTAEQAQQIGLVDEVVPTPDDLDAALERWFTMMRPAAPHAIQRVKRAIINDDESHQFGTSFSCADAQEGMRAFLEKRPPAWME